VATVERHVNVPPEAVFEVLSDGWTYSNWVVGTSHMRAVDAHWPAVGAKLHHASGIWPLALRDETVVDSVDTNRCIALTVRVRPFGDAKVVMRLEPEAGGTMIRMEEAPTSGPGKWLDNPAMEAMLARRNVEALARLAAIAERRTTPVEAE
jgi:uncharacterized protein YndB with AHSA1/START domain